MTRAGQRRRHHPHSKRREERVQVALPVKVSIVGGDSNPPGARQFACTLDATKRGARLSGLNDSVQKGMRVEVERSGKRDLFQVVWVGAPGSAKEGQVGLSCIREEVTVFGADALEPPPAPPEKPKAAVQPPPAPAKKESGAERNTSKVYVALATVALLLVTLVAVVGTRASKSSIAAPPAETLIAGMDPALASHIRNLRGWRLAQPADFDANAASYLAARGRELKGEALLLGSGAEAYILAPAQSSEGSTSSIRRIILAENHTPKYDINLPRLALAASVPRDQLASIDWKGATQQQLQATSDGILLVGNMSDAGTGLVLFFSGNRVVARTATDYHALSLAP